MGLDVYLMSYALSHLLTSCCPAVQEGIRSLIDTVSGNEIGASNHSGSVLVQGQHTLMVYTTRLSMA
jgi:hypothetical protein